MRARFSAKRSLTDGVPELLSAKTSTLNILSLEALIRSATLSNCVLCTSVSAEYPHAYSRIYASFFPVLEVFDADLLCCNSSFKAAFSLSSRLISSSARFAFVVCRLASLRALRASVSASAALFDRHLTFSNTALTSVSLIPARSKIYLVFGLYNNISY